VDLGVDDRSIAHGLLVSVGFLCERLARRVRWHALGCLVDERIQVRGKLTAGGTRTGRMLVIRAARSAAVFALVAHHAPEDSNGAANTGGTNTAGALGVCSPT